MSNISNFLVCPRCLSFPAVEKQLRLEDLTTTNDLPENITIIQFLRLPSYSNLNFMHTDIKYFWTFILNLASGNAYVCSENQKYAARSIFCITYYIHSILKYETCNKVVCRCWILIPWFHSYSNTYIYCKQTKFRTK